MYLRAARGGLAATIAASCSYKTHPHLSIDLGESSVKTLSQQCEEDLPLMRQFEQAILRRDKKCAIALAYRLSERIECGDSKSDRLGRARAVANVYAAEIFGIELEPDRHDV